MPKTITHDRAKEIVARLNNRMNDSGGRCRMKEVHGDGSEIYRLDFEVSVGDNVPLFQTLQGAALNFSDPDYDHMASHYVIKCASRDGLAGLA